MSGIATAIIGSAVVTSYASSKAASKAASATSAAAQIGAEAQEEASRLGIDEQRRQFDSIVQTFAPYIEAGNIAISGDPMGMLGRERRLQNLLTPVLSDQQAVSSAFNLILGRPPSTEDLDFYTARLNEGVSREELVNQIAGSKEGLARIALPEGASQEEFAAKLNAFNAAKDRALAEVTQRPATQDIVKQGFAEYLGRAPSEQDIQFYSQRIDSGLSPQEFFGQLQFSEEGSQFDQRLQSRGLTPYLNVGAEMLPRLQEFAAVGTDALKQQRALAGLDGPEAQQAAIAQIEAGPGFQALTRQGEEAILQRASATGGLRGGNVQAALAQFRPTLLNQFIEQQYGKLGGLTNLGGAATEQLFKTGVGGQELLARLGQASAANQAAGATTLGTGIAGSLGQIGTAQANRAGTIGAAQSANAIAQAQALGNFGQSIPNALIMSRFLAPPPAPGTMYLGGGI